MRRVGIWKYIMIFIQIQVYVGNFFDVVRVVLVGGHRGVINMRHPYAAGNWNSNCKTDVHSSDVANIEAEKEDASLQIQTAPIQT